MEKVRTSTNSEVSELFKGVMSLRPNIANIRAEHFTRSENKFTWSIIL